MKQYFIILFLFGLSTLTFSEETIRIATAEWKPYISKSLKHYGVYTHIITEAFALEGVKAEIEFFPWPRAEHNAQIGKLDAMATLVSTPERKKVFYLSDIVYSSKRVFFHLKSFSFDWKTMDDLKDIEIGATIGYKYGDIFQNAEAEGKILVERVPKDGQNFKKMLFNRIKVFPFTLEAGYFMLKEQFSSEEAEKITHHPKILQNADYHLMFPKSLKSSQKLLDLFNKGLKKLKASGKYDQMLNDARNGKYVIKK